MQKTEIIGNVVGDAQTRTTQTGVEVCSFTVAVNEKGANKENDVTYYFKVEAWRKLAEICGKYVVKGMKIYVNGKMKIPKPYTTKGGETRCDLCMTANDVEFLNRVEGKSSSEPPEVPQEYQSAPQQNFTDVSSEFLKDELPF